MEKEFVPYTESLALKKLGFDEPCFALYGKSESNLYLKHNDKLDVVDDIHFIKAPTFSQAFRWFREKYGLDSSIALVANGYGFYIHKNRNYTNRGESYGVNITYEEAELACLRKLIEIVKNK